MHVFPSYSSCKCHQYWTCIKIQPSLICKSSYLLWLACVVAMAQSGSSWEFHFVSIHGWEWIQNFETGNIPGKQGHFAPLQAFNLSIKVWSTQRKDLRINSLAKVPGWGLAEPHGRLHMSEKYVSKLYTLHFVSWFPCDSSKSSPRLFFENWEESND